MSPGEVDAMTAEQRLAWVNSQLGPHVKLVQESAKRNRVPERLLAIVILNELADYKMDDVVFESVFTTKYTVGMAQTSVNRTLERGELEGLISEEEIKNHITSLTRKTTGGSRKELAGETIAPTRESAVQYLAWKKLNEPAGGIEVAAREISRLMDLMSKDPSGPWAKHFLKGPIDRANPFASMKPAHYPGQWDDAKRLADWEQKLQRDGRLRRYQETSLTLAVIAAYNSDKILTKDVEHRSVFQTPADDAFFPDARKHAVNGVEFFLDLLFDKNWPTPKTETAKAGTKFYVEWYDKQERILCGAQRYKTPADAEKHLALLKTVADDVVLMELNGSYVIRGKAWHLIAGLDAGSEDDAKLQQAKAGKEKDGYKTRIVTVPNWGIHAVDMSNAVRPEIIRRFPQKKD